MEKPGLEGACPPRVAVQVPMGTALLCLSPGVSLGDEISVGDAGPHRRGIRGTLGFLVSAGRADRS